MKLLAVVVFYKTKLDELNLVRQLKEERVETAFYDNGVTEKVKNEIDRIWENDQIWLGDGENVGLSHAYNKALEYARTHGFSFVCLFDQDSQIQEKYFLKVADIINEHNNAKFGILTPFVYYEKSTSVNRKKNEITLVDWAISSGSIVSVDAAFKISGFDERYFIDRVDAEFCYRLINYGYKIYKSSDLALFQNLGYINVGVFGAHYNHSCTRHYYISRNRCLFYLRTCVGGWRQSVCLIAGTIKHIAGTLLFEDNKLYKIIAIAIGVKDFYQGRFGKADYVFKIR